MSANSRAVLAYIPPIALLFLLVEPYKSDRPLRLHSVQSIFLFVATVMLYVAVGVLGTIIAIIGTRLIAATFTTLTVLTGFVLWVFVPIKAYSGKALDVPILSNFARRFL